MTSTFTSPLLSFSPSLTSGQRNMPKDQFLECLTPPNTCPNSLGYLGLRQTSEVSPLQVAFFCFIFIQNWKSKQTVPSILPAFHQSYQICHSLLFSTPRHPKIQPQLLFCSRIIHFPEVGMCYFLFLGSIPSLSAWKVPTYPIISRASVTSSLQLSPTP